MSILWIEDADGVPYYPRPEDKVSDRPWYRFAAAANKVGTLLGADAAGVAFSEGTAFGPQGVPSVGISLKILKPSSLLFAIHGGAAANATDLQL